MNTDDPEFNGTEQDVAKIRRNQLNFNLKDKQRVDDIESFNFAKAQIQNYMSIVNTIRDRYPNDPHFVNVLESFNQLPFEMEPYIIEDSNYRKFNDDYIPFTAKQRNRILKSYPTPEMLSKRKGTGVDYFYYMEGWKAVELANMIWGENGWNSRHEIKLTGASQKNGKFTGYAVVSCTIKLATGGTHMNFGAKGMFGDTKEAAIGISPFFSLL